MHPESTRPAPPPPPATVHGATAPVHWTIQIDATSEQLLLARILQKLAVPEIELHTVHFVAGRAGSPARVAVGIWAAPAWAELVARRLRKLVHVHRVELHPG